MKLLNALLITLAGLAGTAEAQSKGNLFQRLADGNGIATTNQLAVGTGGLTVSGSTSLQNVSATVADISTLRVSGTLSVSGNIVGSGVSITGPMQVPPLPSNYAAPLSFGISFMSAGTDSAYVTNTIYYKAFYVASPTTISNLGLKFATSGTAASYLQGIYSNNPATNRPQTLLTTTPSSSVTGTSQQIWAAVSQTTLTPGFYWRAWDISASAVPQVVGFNGSDCGYTVAMGELSSTLIFGGGCAQAFTEARNMSLGLPGTANATPSRTSASGGPITLFSPN